jgi:hypothetical protein
MESVVTGAEKVKQANKGQEATLEKARGAVGLGRKRPSKHNKIHPALYAKLLELTRQRRPAKKRTSPRRARAVSYTPSPSPRDLSTSRMPSSA